MGKQKVVCLLAMLTLVVSGANAGMIVNDTFDNLNLGNLGGQETWVAYGPAYEKNLQVVVDATVPTGGNHQVAQFIRDTSTGYGTAKLSSFPGNYVIAETDTQVNISYWYKRSASTAFGMFYIKPTNSNIYLSGIQMYNTATKVVTTTAGGGTEVMYDKTGDSVPDRVFAAVNEWVKYELNVNNVTNRADVFVTDSLGRHTLALNLAVPEITGALRLEFTPYNNVGDSIYIDDLKIESIPEPVTAGLLLTGMYFAARRRK